MTSAAAPTRPPAHHASQAPAPLFEEVGVDEVRSCLDADAGAVLAWLADHASEWAATDEDRAALTAAVASR